AAKRVQSWARPAIDDQLRIIEQLRTPLLEGVHQGVLFVRIKRLIEAPRGLKRVAPRQEITENKFLFARLPQPAHGVVARPARSQRQPTRQRDGKDLFARRRVRRTKVRPA